MRLKITTKENDKFCIEISLARVLNENMLLLSQDTCHSNTSILIFSKDKASISTIYECLSNYGFFDNSVMNEWDIDKPVSLTFLNNSELADTITKIIYDSKICKRCSIDDFMRIKTFIQQNRIFIS